jgi:hypothetical protein
MNELHAKAGVHVLSLYAQVHELAAIEEIIERHEVRYPIAFDGFWEEGYQARVLPHIWIVGVDGKVRWSGRRGYTEALAEAMKEVEFPGLGLREVHEQVRPAADAFVAGRFADAYRKAEALMDNSGIPKVEDQAMHIVRRVDDRISSLKSRAEMAEILLDYELALRCWEALAAYSGVPGTEDFAERRKALEDNEDVDLNRKAQRELLALMMSLDVAFQSVDDENADQVTLFRLRCLRRYQEFAREHPATGAAEYATELADVFKELLGIE